MEKTCKICGNSFIRRDDEATKDYNKRQTCSKECGNEAISKTLTKYSTEDRVCEICGEDFSKRQDEKPAVFIKRRTCSKECFSVLRGNIRKISLPPKICEICGKEFSRRDDEATTDFYTRKTCSKECGFKLAGRNESVDTLPKNCVVCGKEFLRKCPTEKIVEFNQRKTCSAECSLIIGMHSTEAREKSKETHLEKYGVPSYVMTKECRNSYNTISKPNKEFAKKLEELGIEYEMEFPLERYSYDLRVGDTLVEINPFAFHNVTFSPFGNIPDKDYHKNKTLTAIENGFRCVHVWDWDDTDKIIQLFTSRETLYARNLEIKDVEQKECREFLQKYHLQNDTRSQPIRLGLYDKDLIMVMTFGTPRYNKNFEYEMLRLCTKTGYKVVGGANRLFKYFLNNYQPKSVLSYCDMSKFTGEVYLNLGFTLLKENAPSKHWYHPNGSHFTDGQLRKQGFDRLVGKEYNISYGKGTSNEELMRSYGYTEVFDTGQNTYVIYE